MTPLSRALEQFEKLYIELNGTLYDAKSAKIKSFISDFYRQILTEDIERLQGMKRKLPTQLKLPRFVQTENPHDIVEAATHALTDEYNSALSSEITHKKQLLKELE